jgi:hypothetical protein
VREGRREGRTGPPCIVASSFPEVESEADPALDHVPEDEEYGVDIDEAASQIDGNDFTHPDLDFINGLLRWGEKNGHTGTAARIMNADAPAKKRKTRNSAMLVLPAKKAPDTMAVMADWSAVSWFVTYPSIFRCHLRLLQLLTTAIAHFRPHLSATQGRERVPMTPPVWKRPFMEEMRSTPLLRVAKSKYSIKDG